MQLLSFPFFFMLISSPFVALMYLIISLKMNKLPTFISVIIWFYEVFALVVCPMIVFNTSHPYIEAPCCDTPDWFEPFNTSYLIGIEIITIFSIICYFLSKLLKQIVLAPLVELIISSGLLIGLLLAVAVGWQVIRASEYAFFGSLPIILLMLSQIVLRSRYLYARLHTQTFSHPMQAQMWAFLNASLWRHYGFAAVLCAPFLLIISLLLTLFGQKPDAIILAFTQTYMHSFSELSCNAGCNYASHYLCTVASEGSPQLVKPLRQGIRNGALILVNRQLLVANAFEEILENKAPRLHKIIRKIYDELGFRFFKTHLTIRSKSICNIVYLLMKPLEWAFVLVLYCYHPKPENELALQYLPPTLRSTIKAQMSKLSADDTTAPQS